MIFSDKKLVDEVINVRFYYWSDPNKGWGDAGTKGYYNIPLKYFEETKNERHVGGFYYTYELNLEKGEEILGKGFWMNYGYDLYKEEERIEEVQLHNLRLEVSNKAIVIS